MTTASAPVPVATPRSRYLAIGAAASVAHLLMMIPGYNEDGSFQTTDWLVVLLISLVVAGLLFTFVVPGAGTVTALVLGVVALVSVLVFWAGVTLPVAAAGAVAAWRARASGDRPGMATAALALSALATVALVAIIIGDAVSN